MKKAWVAKFANLEEQPSFRQFSSKLSEFLGNERSDKSVPSSWDHCFWEHTFLAWMRRLRSGWPLSAPTIAYFWYPQQIGNSFRNWQMMSAFTPGLLRLNKSIASLQHSTLYGIRTIGTRVGRNIENNFRYYWSSGLEFFFSIQ